MSPEAQPAHTIEHLRLAEGHAKPSHAHASGQLLWLRRGVIACESPALRWHMAAGQAGWIPAGLAHAARAIGPVEAWVLRPTTHIPDWPGHVRVLAGSRLFDAAFQRLVELTPVASPRCATLVRVLAEEVAGAPDVPQQLPMPDDPRLSRACESVLAAPGQPWTLDRMSATYGLSRSTLARRMQAAVGMSFGRWLQHARLLHAARLLAGGMSVAEAGDQAGFQGTSAFCSAFRNQHGLTPGAYRRLHGR